MEEHVEGNEAPIRNENEDSKCAKSSPVKEKTEQHKTGNEELDEEFNNEIQTILERLKSLPSEASEIKMPRAPRDTREIYSKLCKALDVPENSTFMHHADDEKMDFSYHCLGPVGIIPVTKALTTCQTVKIVDFKYNKLGAESLPAIILLVDQNENISHLNIQSNRIGKGSARMLSELISRCFSVEFLDLSNNDLGDEELEEIGLSLLKIDCVKELVLNMNDFSSAKAQTFGSCITKCSALQKLDLSCCHLEEGVKSIFGGLKNSNLTILNLARNGIPDDAAAAIATGLRTNKTLQELDISYNLISNKGAKILAPGLKRSATLEVMKLVHNPIHGSAATTLLNSVGASLKVLDLTGIRVNLAFYKTLASYTKAGKGVKVLYGSEIRYASLPKDFMVPDEDSLSKHNALSYIEMLADEKGVSLRSLMKNIHATFIAEQHAAMLEEDEAGKKEDKPQREAGKKEDKPRRKAGKKEDEPRPEMSTQDLAKILSNSLIAIPRALALKLAELLSEDGFVNMWELIANIKWKPDDLNIKIKEPKQLESEKPKGKEKKK